MTYPSVLTTFTDPVPTDKLSTTPHSSIETAQNNGLRELQAFVGTDSSVVGTLQYDIRGAGSNGGGHVQTANKGGTGQTAYTKGDVLVATSSSVLTKLAVGTDTNALVADSTTASGVKWAGVATAANIQNQTYTYARASIMSGSVYGINLGQAVSVLTDGMGFVVRFPNNNTTSLIALTVNATGPSSVSALIKRTDLTNFATNDIQASMIGVLEFDSVSSVFQMINSKAITPYSQTYRTTATYNSIANNTITPGFQAKAINVHAAAAPTGNTDPGAYSHGGWDVTNGNMCVGRDTASGAVVSTVQCLHVGATNNVNLLTGSISSVTSTNFILTTGVGAQTAQVYIECIG